jgi:hypothetical protein
VRRAIVIALLAASSALALLMLPASAAAGTYTWKMPGDFTSTPPGSNPDHDSYGAKPWSYVEGPATVSVLNGPDPSTGPFSMLPTFSSTIAGGLRGWTDTLNTNAFVALNPTASKIGVVPPGQLALNPAAARVAGVGWTSPLPHPATVSVTGTVTADSSCSGAAAVWSLSQNDTAVQSGTGSGAISQSVPVNPGGTIYFAVSYSQAQLLYDPACATVGLTLQITANQNTAPTPTLDSPANGALISGGQPTFSGSAGTTFAASNKITVFVFRGTTPGGTPVQTLTTTRGPNGGYSVGMSSPLGDGQYTAVAEQDDVASPPDPGFSRPTTFTIHNAPPSIQLNSPGSKPLTDPTPTLSGQGGNSPGDSTNIILAVYSGTSTNGTAVRTIQGTRNADGSFSIQVTPALPDGEYTAVAVQGSPRGIATSPPQTFRIKVHGPALTMTKPAPGASIPSQAPVFTGTAGNALGDSTLITVVVYNGHKASGTPVGTMPITRTGATWSAVWTHPLKLGTYTAVAKQSDDAGHTTVTPAVTFQIVPGPNAIGTLVTMSRHGQPTARVSITCIAPPGETCSGSVLVITKGRYRAMPGGPIGQLQVLFAYVSVPSGQTTVVTRPVNAAVARLLRRSAPVKVEVSASLTTPVSSPTGYGGVRTLRLAS